MKKCNVYPITKTFIITLMGLLTLSSCEKSDQFPDATPREFWGEWKLSDLVLVNEGERLRKLEEHPRLNDLRLILSPNGQLSAGGKETGTWSISNHHLLIRFDGEELWDLKISKSDPSFMVLEQSFDEHDGRERGTLYYAFAK
jgi:hypothetical protein